MDESKQRDMGAGPSTKRLKAMLKLMTEFGVIKYRDDEVEIQMTPQEQAIQRAMPSGFSIDRYEPEAEVLSDEQPDPDSRDDLGYSDDDYLWRSAET